MTDFRTALAILAVGAAGILAVGCGDSSSDESNPETGVQQQFTEEQLNAVQSQRDQILEAIQQRIEQAKKSGAPEDVQERLEKAKRNFEQVQEQALEQAGQ